LAGFFGNSRAEECLPQHKISLNSIIFQPLRKEEEIVGLENVGEWIIFPPEMKMVNFQGE
jgi:hypothetical protein